MPEALGRPKDNGLTYFGIRGHYLSYYIIEKIFDCLEIQIKSKLEIQQIEKASRKELDTQ